MVQKIFGLKKWTSAFFTLLALLLLFSGMTVTALAAEQEYTVGEGKDYATIQQAVDAIVENYQEGTSYLIAVDDGEYARFLIPHGVSNITVRGSGNTVVRTKTGDSFETSIRYSPDQDTDGILIWGADITLENLKITSGTTHTKWLSAAVSTYDGHAGAGAETYSNITLKNCTLTGSGNGNGFMPDRSVFTVDGCTITGYEQAIYFACDNYVMAGASIQNNTISDCVYAIHGYYGGQNLDNTSPVQIKGNTIVGTNERFAVIAIMDQSNKGSFAVDMSGNDFTYTIVGGINLRKSGDVAQGSLEALQNCNDFNRTSFIADAYWYSAEEYGSTYYAPEIDGCIATWYANPLMENPDYKDKITEALEQAGTVSNVVVINAPMQETFTLSKNAILLKGYEDLGELTVSKSVKGSSLDRTAFGFELVLTNSKGEPLSGEYAYIDADGETKTLTGGKLTFTLSDGQSIIVKNLLPGTRYTVKETDAKGYASSPAAGYLDKELTAGKNTAAFVNSKPEDSSQSNSDSNSSSFSSHKPIPDTGSAASKAPIGGLLLVSLLSGAILATMKKKA